MDILRKLLLILGVAALFLPLGCSTPRPYPWSWAHNKRRINVLLSGFENAAESFDRIVLQDYTKFPGRLHKASLDFDRIVFEMDERTLEDL